MELEELFFLQSYLSALLADLDAAETAVHVLHLRVEKPAAAWFGDLAESLRRDVSLVHRQLQRCRDYVDALRDTLNTALRQWLNHHLHHFTSESQ